VADGVCQWPRVHKLGFYVCYHSEIKKKTEPTCVETDSCPFRPCLPPRSFILWFCTCTLKPRGLAASSMVLTISLADFLLVKRTSPFCESCGRQDNTCYNSGTLSPSQNFILLILELEIVLEECGLQTSGWNILKRNEQLIHLKMRSWRSFQPYLWFLK
jgi:hypothetical protein